MRLSFVGGLESLGTSNNFVAAPLLDVSITLEA